MTYQVWYIDLVGRHRMRKEHSSLLSAMRHSLNLSEYNEGFFSYIVDTDTNMVCHQDYDGKIEWRERK